MTSKDFSDAMSVLYNSYIYRGHKLCSMSMTLNEIELQK